MDSEMFRALARSSPWRWSSVRLTRTMIGQDDGEQVRAWIRRPGLMRVEYLKPAGRRPYAVNDRDDVRSGRGIETTMFIAIDDDAVPGVQPPQLKVSSPLDSRAAQPEFLPPQDPRAPQPERRPDGLVSWRPDDFGVEYDDPMHQNYYWVAMLDPVELADGDDPDEEPALHSVPPPGVDILDVAEEQRLGRPTLVATVRPNTMYNPRCTCCALLFNEVTVAFLQEEDGPLPDSLPRLADAHRVALDRQTGICVSIHDVGGDHDGNGFDVEIEEVDADYPGSMFR